MNVSAISSSNWLKQISNANNQGNTVPQSGGVSNPAAQAGGFESLLLNALTGSYSLSGSSSASGTSSGNSSGGNNGSTTSLAAGQQQALTSFMQNLFQALHAQNVNGSSAAGSGSDPDSDGDNGSTTSGVSSGHRPDRDHNMAADVQSLINQIASSTGSATNSAGATTSSSTSSSSALSALQTSFQTLASSLGLSGSNANLGNFLSTLEGSLPNQQPGASASGQVLNTKA